MRHEEDDSVPVLNAVVESGNESIIQSSRLGREVLRELEQLQESEPVKFVLQDHILENEEEEGDPQPSTERQLDLKMDDSEEINAPVDDSSDAIELMIDEVVDRHIVELRKDIRHLLTQLKHQT